jgi:hypothetical protein
MEDIQMINDNLLRFCTALAISASAAATDHIDLGADRNIGMGEPMAVLITVDVAAAVDDADETYAFKIQTDTVTGFGSPTDVIERSIGRALLTAGSMHAIPVPPDTSMEQFMRIYATLGGTTPTITYTAMLVPMSAIPKEATYPSGSTIS